MSLFIGKIEQGSGFNSGEAIGLLKSNGKLSGMLLKLDGGRYGYLWLKSWNKAVELGLVDPATAVLTTTDGWIGNKAIAVTKTYKPDGSLHEEVDLMALPLGIEGGSKNQGVSFE